MLEISGFGRLETFILLNPFSISITQNTIQTRIFTKNAESLKFTKKIPNLPKFYHSSQVKYFTKSGHTESTVINSSSSSLGA
jgi:hypothetical protein